MSGEIDGNWPSQNWHPCFTPSFTRQILVVVQCAKHQVEPFSTSPEHGTCSWLAIFKGGNNTLVLHCVLIDCCIVSFFFSFFRMISWDSGWKHRWIPRTRPGQPAFLVFRVDHGRPMQVEQIGIGWWVNCLRSSGEMVLHVSRSTLIYQKMIFKILSKI